MKNLLYIGAVIVFLSLVVLRMSGGPSWSPDVLMEPESLTASSSIGALVASTSPFLADGNMGTSTQRTIESRERDTQQRVVANDPKVTGAAFVWKQAIATVFWVGEGETEDNDYISNTASAWDENWQVHFGGYDDPDCRREYSPCGFVPRENPFYVALPYNDLDDQGNKKPGAPTETRDGVSSLKNTWIAVRHGNTTCFAQWEDVGPFEEDDRDYVLGDAQTPLNTFGMKAGIDLSPAVRDCLGVGDVSTVLWARVLMKDVPTGPWKETVTRR